MDLALNNLQRLMYHQTKPVLVKLVDCKKIKEKTESKLYLSIT